MDVLEWLMDSCEPWTRYRTLVDLLDRPVDDPQVRQARQEMLQHPSLRGLMDVALAWGEQAFKRHNDAAYSIYAISTLADFGLRAEDPGLQPIIEKVLAHRSPEGAFQSIVNIPQAFGGDGLDRWTWLICDTPTLLYSLLAFGLEGDGRVQQAVDHLATLAQENGWRCVCDPALGRFRGPGKKPDACPIANVYALKALAQVPALLDSPAVRAGVEMLLSHWADPAHSKPYLFGAGSDYRKLKYPFVWYNILHVADVLSRFPLARGDARFQAMLDTLAIQANAEGRYTATSMYQSWKGWSFADKKNPSPWLTFLVLRLYKRIGDGLDAETLRKYSNCHS